MNASFPKLKGDLIVRQQQMNGSTFFIVKDPLSGKFFRFREAEQFIAAQLDGETPPDVICRNVEAKFNAELPPESLSSFIRMLQESDLLERAAARKTKAGLKGRVRGSALYLRFKLFDPTAMFDHLIDRVGFLFTPLFVGISFFFILMGIWTTIANWTEFAQDLSRLYDLTAVLPFLATNLLMITLHESAHGLTLRHFGGEVREVGFMMIYFQPAFYCNVSDAWLLPEKRKRLWVSFAGPYFELFIWSLATLVWRITETDTWLNYFGLIIMTTSGIKTLANFNPLIKLDGYYLLSDLVGIPNLRKRSFRYIGDLTKRLTGSSLVRSGSISGRERLIYLAYGGVATVFSFFLLAYGTIKAVGFLVSNNQPVALTVLMGFVGLRFRDRLTRLYGNQKGKLDATDEDDGSSGPVGASEPEPQAPSKKAAPRKKWNFRRWAFALIGLLIIGILIFGRMELIVKGSFVILPVRNADVRTEVDGIIEDIRFHEGDRVKAGDVIAHLSERENRTELQKTETQITEARARLRMLQLGATPQEIELERTNVETLRERLQFAQTRLKRYRLLYEKDLLSRMEYEDYEGLVIAAAGQLAEAQKRLNVVLMRTRPEQIDEVNAQIASLMFQKSNLEEKIRYADVRAAISGVIGTPGRQLEAMIGQSVQKGAVVAQVFDARKLSVEIAVSEKDIANVGVGQEVLFKTRAYPDRTFNGKVTSTATTAMASSSGGVPMSVLNVGSSSTSIIVTTIVDNDSTFLMPGMTGQAKIMCGERRILSIIAMRLAHMVKIEFWSWW